MIASDRSQELKNFQYEEALFNLERTFSSYVTKDDLTVEMREKVSLIDMDEMKESFSKLQTIQGGDMEGLTEKITTLKEEYEQKIKDMDDRVEELHK